MNYKARNINATFSDEIYNRTKLPIFDKKNINKEEPSTIPNKTDTPINEKIDWAYEFEDYFRQHTYIKTRRHIK